MNFLRSFIRGISTGTGIIAAVGIGAVVLAAGGGVLLASQSDGGSPYYGECYVVGFSGWNPPAIDAFLPVFTSDPDETANEQAQAWFGSGMATLFSGVNVQRYRYYQWSEALAGASRAYRAGKKIVIAGHSSGGAAAINLAFSLNNQYIPIAYMLEIDTFTGSIDGRLVAQIALDAAGAVIKSPKLSGLAAALLPAALIFYAKDHPTLSESRPAPTNVNRGLNYYHRSDYFYWGRPETNAQFENHVVPALDDERFPWSTHAGMPTYVAKLGNFKSDLDSLCLQKSAPPQTPPPDGSVVQQAEPGDQRPIYHIEGGKKRKASLEVVQSCGWLNQLTTAPKATLDAMPNGPDVPPCETPTKTPTTTVKYCISGLVTRADTGGGGVAAVVTITGPTNRNKETDASGGYSVCDLPPGSYQVSPNAAGFSFAPPSRTVQITGGNVSVETFSASPGGGCIRGQVTTSAGASAPLTGAVLRLSDGRTAISEARGEYSFCGTRPGAYRVTGSLAGAKSFSPDFKDVTVPDSGDSTGNNFIAEIERFFCVSGQLTQSAGPSQPIGGIPILIDGIEQAKSGADGRYSKCGLPEGPHTVAPVHSDWAFGPENRQVIGPPDQTAGFTGSIVKRFCIGGFATGSQGPSTPFTGLAVQIGGPDTSATSTNVDGSYKACGLREGRYAVVINPGPELVCNPNPRPVFLSGGDALSEGFTCTSIVPPKCPSPQGPLFPADGARVAPGQQITLQWPGQPNCRYSVTLLEGCKGAPVPLLDTPSWNVGALPTGSRCGWFVQGVDSSYAFDSPVAQWWVYWGFETPTPITPTITPTPVTPSVTPSPTTAVPTTVTAPPTTVTTVPAEPTTATATTPAMSGPRIQAIGCTGSNRSGLDNIWLANWGDPFACAPSITGTVSSWSWTAPGGSPSSGAGTTFATSFASTGPSTVTLQVCNASGCDVAVQTVRTPNCDVAPDPVSGPFIRAISPSPCSVVPAGQPITFRWSVDFRGQAPPSTMFMAIVMGECVPTGEGAGYGSNMFGENSATIGPLPAGVRCRWRVRATQNGTAEAGPFSNDFFFYVR